MSRSLGKSLILHSVVQLLVLLLGLNIARAEQFHSAKVIPIAAAPGAIAAGDLNGDGKGDLLHVDTLIHILIGNGDGTFQPETTLDPGMSTRAVTIADVNGDGYPDILAVGNGLTTTATVNVFLGNGDGTFQVPPLKSVVAQSNFLFPAITALSLGDFDGDGKLDLLASDGLNDVVTFSRGDGRGHFTLQMSLFDGGTPGQILVADLNHDGHLDFAVHGILGADEEIFIGHGDGTFAPGVSYRGPDDVTGAVLVDMDGDGNLDMVVTGMNSSVDILLGRSDGTFSDTSAGPGVFYSAAAGSAFPAGNFNHDGGPNLPTISSNGVIFGAAYGGVFDAEDFNHDGLLDIAVASRNGITILLGAPGLTFTVAGTYAATALPDLLAIADFNGDGQPDFAVSGVFSKQIAILLSKPDGTLNGANAYDVGAAVNSVTIADVNRDGTSDLLVGTARSTPSVLLGLGSGNYQLPADAPQLFGATRGGSVDTADFNGDGKLDLLFAHDGGLAYIQLGNGNGTFQSPLPVVSNPAGNMSVDCAGTADLNNDHRADVVLNTFFFAGNGDGTFLTPSGAFTSGRLSGCVPLIADFNGDGKLDIAFPELFTSNISVQLGNGDGTFGPVANYDVGNPAFDLATGDFNGDGIVDLVATIGFRNSAAILLGQADGTFKTPTVISTGSHQESRVTVGDVDGDGKQDLVLSDGFVITVMHGNGDGTFQAGADYASGTGTSKPQLADLNGDGELDIAFANFDVNTATTVTILLNQSGRTVRLASSAPSSQFGQSVVLSIAVKPTVADSPTPTGTATLTNDGATLGAGALAGGSFGVTTATLPVGTHNIAGNYSGDSLYKAKALPALVQTVIQATTTSVLNTTANPNFYHQPLTLTARVTPAFTGTPTGPVTFSEGATVLGSSPLGANGFAAIDLSALSAGTHNITASYAGDIDFKSSVSATLPQVVFFPTTIAATGSSSRQLATSPFTVSVNVSSPNGTPAGQVTVMDGSVALPPVTLDQTGSASFSTTALTAGTHSLSAIYAGNGFFNRGISTTFTYDVVDFSLNASPAAATISRGASAAFNLTVNPVNGFNGNVAFACQGLPAFTSCTFNPPTLTPNGGPVNATLTVTTATAAASTLPLSAPTPLKLLWLVGLLCGLLAALELARRNPLRPLPALRFSLHTFAIGGCLLLASCGGGGHSPPATQPPPPTTSSITVSSTATSGSVSDSHSLAVTITIN